MNDFRLKFFPIKMFFIGKKAKIIIVVVILKSETIIESPEQQQQQRKVFIGGGKEDKMFPRIINVFDKRGHYDILCVPTPRN